MPWQDLNTEWPSDPIYHKHHIGVPHIVRKDIIVQQRRNFQELLMVCSILLCRISGGGQGLL